MIFRMDVKYRKTWKISVKKLEKTWKIRQTNLEKPGKWSELCCINPAHDPFHYHMTPLLPHDPFTIVSTVL